MASPWFDKLTTNGVGFRPDGMTSGVGAGVGVVGVGWISAAERRVFEISINRFFKRASPRSAPENSCSDHDMAVALLSGVEKR